MAAFSIVIQPPARAQVSTTLHPPLVAELNFRGAVTGHYFFAMALLLTREGNIVEGGLSGTTSVNGVDVTTARSSRTTIYFPYTDLAILAEGAYKIRVDVYKVAYDSPGGYDFQALAKSSRVAVVNEAVPAVSAGSTERSIIRALQAAGVSIH
ncbi:velvet factor domain containing protein [Fusarium agapanthi]|uniref:Velvet factor domain containing protein n=1 Tax=Fusarium agapanthi TaxID=1803897 RepID=A0A9P5AW70_9HYPO|nr:velvet factor domain containing protein [Fusarium agapanthi]